MEGLRRTLGVPVEPVETCWLGRRCAGSPVFWLPGGASPCAGLPLSFPTTTGVSGADAGAGSLQCRHDGWLAIEPQAGTIVPAGRSVSLSV